MRIGVYSKMDMTGGSELRCAEIASEIARQGKHEAWLLAERDIPMRVRSACHPGVRVIANVMRNAGRAPLLYQMDRMVVVVTDSTVMPTVAYWRGESDRHATWTDLPHTAPIWAFLFNYRVTPAVGLASIAATGRDVRVICANTKFSDQIATSPKLAAVSGLPRIVLESPIDPSSVWPSKSGKCDNRLRVGCFSKPSASKWCRHDWPAVINAVERQHPHRVEWRLMGCPAATLDAVMAGCSRSLIEAHPEFAMPVGEFLDRLDAFLFLTDAKREEPWARSVAEAMLSGCPVIARDKGGTREQVAHGIDGWLCIDAGEIAERVCDLVRQPDLAARMGARARDKAHAWTSPAVVGRLLDFLDVSR